MEERRDEQGIDRGKGKRKRKIRGQRGKEVLEAERSLSYLIHEGFLGRVDTSEAIKWRKHSSRKKT